MHQDADDVEEFEAIAHGELNGHDVRFHRRHHFIVRCAECGKAHISPSFDDNTAKAQKWAVGRLLAKPCDTNPTSEWFKKA
jgi:hypothetical protein